MERSLSGNPLPTNEADFADNVNSFKNVRCVICDEYFTRDNVHTKAGWRETQLSGFCENCFDGLFKDE